MTSFPAEQIISSFEGKLSEHEELQLQQWLEESPDHQRQFDELKKVYEATKLIRIGFRPDEQKALQAVNRKLRTHRIAVWSYRIAASFAFLFLLSRAVFYFIPDNNFQEINTVSQQAVYLPDSSKVILAARSYLKYQKQFGGKERDVVLRGKAYFDVRRNKQKPFVISTANTKVRVLGTRFLVDAHDLSREMVVVDEGKVAFSSIKAKNKPLELAASKIGIWNAADSSLIEQTNLNPNLNAAFSNRLVFNDTSLKEVIRDFENYFQVHIVLKGRELENLNYSGTFSDIQAESAINILANSLNLTVSKKDNIYFIQP